MWFFVVILGVIAGLTDNDWPPIEALFLLGLIAVSLLRQCISCRVCFATGLGILAYLYVNVYLAVLFENSLPEYLYGQSLQVDGEVVDVLKASENHQQVRFQVDDCQVVALPVALKAPSKKQVHDDRCRFSGDVILNRYFKPLSDNNLKGDKESAAIDDLSGRMRPGERWRLSVRLYPIRGFVNPGQSRYRLLQLAKGIMGRGYVKNDAQSLRLSAASQWRQWQSDWRSAFRVKAGQPGLPLVSTLLTGKSDSLSSEQWSLLQQTGTVHLVVVSGLHLGVLLGAGWLLVSLLPRIVPLDRYWQRLVLLLAPVLLLLPMLLIWPPGVAISRALLMALLVIFIRARGVHISPFSILMFVVILLLISQPLYLLRPGFYYSVWAVALLLMLVSGGRQAGLFLRIQLVLMAGLLPLQHIWLNTPDLISGLINLVAIPLVSLLILPLALVMVLSPFEAVSSLATWLMAFLEPAFWQVLEFGGNSGWGVPVFSPWLYGLLVLFAIVWALPVIPGRAVVLLALLTALVVPGDEGEKSSAKGFEIEVFDVGQGLAVAVAADDQLLVYDTGPVFRSGFAPVAMVLPPRLRSEGLGIDLLVVSHDDRDHAGGLEELLPFSNRVMAGQAERILLDDRLVFSCYQGQTWRWGQVSIEVLYPPKHPLRVTNRSDNDRSCVLKLQSVEYPDQSILLTGDIDSVAEQWLLSSGQDLSARWLVASHHGSAGGNSLAFLSAVSPEGVIYSAGYRNSYGHPAKKVQQRLAYLRREASDAKRNINPDHFPLFYREYNTADLGALKLRDLNGDGRWEIQGQRELIPKRWLWRKLN